MRPKSSTTITKRIINTYFGLNDDFTCVVLLLTTQFAWPKSQFPPKVIFHDFQAKFDEIEGFL